MSLTKVRRGTEQGADTAGHSPRGSSKEPQQRAQAPLTLFDNARAPDHRSGAP
jgi:hypothetical protein